MYSVSFPKYDKNTTFMKTYKIMPRSQNAHAYVNAGFRFTISNDIVKQVPVMIFGGIDPTFINATETETFLYYRQFNDEAILAKAFSLLQSEINPNVDPILASPAYRRSLAVSLFYKFVLAVNDKYVDARFKSATTSVIDTRVLSSGQNTFPTDPTMYPVIKISLIFRLFSK